MKKTIVESLCNSFKLEQVKSDDSQELRWVISGAAMLADKPNLNNRIYPKEACNKAIKKIKSKIENRQVKMSLDHPGFLDGGGKLSNCAGILLSLSEVQEDGYAYYSAQILDTQAGKDLKEILKAGAKIGVSSRGYASSKEDNWPGLDGKYQIIGDDFELETFDFVETPAVVATEATMQLEAKESNMKKSFEEIRQDYLEDFEKMESLFKSEKDTLNVTIESQKKTIDTLQASISALCEQVKTIKPEMFVQTVISETDVTKELEAKLAESKVQFENLSKLNDELNSKVKSFEAEKNKILIENKIAELKKDRPDVFIKVVEDAMAAVNTVEEIQKIFDHNKAICDAFKAVETKKVEEPLTKVDPVAPAKKEESLTIEQEKHLKFINDARLGSGLKVWSIQDYLNTLK